MYYQWTGWWWFGWLIPMVLIAWVLMGWSYRRYGSYGSRYRDMRQREWDDDWSARLGTPGRKYRNRGPLNYRRSDDRIAEDVSDRLMLSDEVDPSALEVRVENGEVILSGTVASRFEKRLAEHIADSVAGVTDVKNQLRIGKVDEKLPPQRPAEEQLPTRPHA
jgi:hypothetical protein